MKKISFLLILITSAFFNSFSQSVGIGTTSPNASAKLDIVATNQGLLPPRLTYSQRNSIVNPAAGLIIWCSTCGSNGELQAYNGSNWQSLMNGVASDSLFPQIYADTLQDFGDVIVLSNSYVQIQAININGAYLTGAPGTITITSPSTDFLVSSNYTTWGATTTLAYSTSDLGASVYVRFIPQTLGLKTGNLMITGGGANLVTVAVKGTGIAIPPVPPAILADTVSSFGLLPVLTNSTSQSFTLSGSNLTGAPGTITVTAPSSDFQLSKDNSTWGGSTSVSYSSATLASMLIYVRFTPLTAGFKAGDITINGGGISSPVTVYVRGTGYIVNPPNLGGIVISQIYGGSGGTYNSDYVELHNNNSAVLSLSGMSIQYGSATSGGFGSVGTLPAVSIPPGGYFLIQMSSPSATGADPLADYVLTPGINMSATNGKVALVNGITALVGCPTTPDVIDLVGYGTSNCFELPAAVPALNTTTAAFRNNNGCNDTNNNNFDFFLGTPSPKNSTSPVNICIGGRN